MHRGFVYAMCGVMASTNKRCGGLARPFATRAREYLPALLISSCGGSFSDVFLRLWVAILWPFLFSAGHFFDAFWRLVDMVFIHSRASGGSEWRECYSPFTSSMNTRAGLNAGIFVLGDDDCCVLGDVAGSLFRTGLDSRSCRSRGDTRFSPLARESFTTSMKRSIVASTAALSMPVDL